MQEYRGMYSLFNAEGSLMRVCMCLCVCSKSSLKQLGQLKPNFMWNHNWGRKFIQMIPVICLYIVILWGAPAFAGFTNVAPHFRALEIEKWRLEKLKAPLFRGPEDTNYWCIRGKKLMQKTPTKTRKLITLCYNECS